MVSLSIVALLLKWPTRTFAAFNSDPISDALGLLWIVALYSAIHIPLDYIGGYWLPCHFSRQCIFFSSFASQYIRALLVQTSFLIVSGLILLQVGRWGGRTAALLLLFLIMLAMIERQDWLARMVAGLSVNSSEKIGGREVVLLSGLDAGFAGGISGLPGREKHLIPAHWQRVLPTGILNLEIEHRNAAVNSGSRLRGLALAIFWNLTGFYLGSLIPGAGVQTHAELFTTALGFTLWSFAGLLVLPAPSRYGVFELDQYARSKGLNESDFGMTIRELDQLQDDEPNRAAGIEAIFHPVPSVGSRLERYRKETRTIGAWNAARYALYLSWPCLGFLNRAVHCNTGRPELWVMLPID